MPLVQLVVTLIVVGVLLWAVNNYIPMDPRIRHSQYRRRAVAAEGIRVLDVARGIRVGAATPIVRVS